MKRFNLSEWALSNRVLVGYITLLLGALGVYSYFHLGQSEDPPFTFRMMVVSTQWPGATADEVDRLVTDRIEEKLQELDGLDYLRSYSRPGESQVFVMFREDLPPAAVFDGFYQVRKKIVDMRYRLPAGIVGPAFNDEFGDTFGNIYALTGADFTYQELKDYSDRIRERLLRIPDVAKVELLGVQEERIYIDIANAKRDQLGIPPELIAQTLAAQNAVAAVGAFDTATAHNLPAHFRQLRRRRATAPSAAVLAGAQLPPRRYCHHPSRLSGSAGGTACASMDNLRSASLFPWPGVPTLSGSGNASIRRSRNSTAKCPSA